MEKKLFEPIALGTWFGLRYSMTGVAGLLYLALGLTVFLVTAIGFKLPAGDALSAGFWSVLILLASELVHQLGHARAAQRLGYPMVGIHFNSLFSICLYPPDEPALPPLLHIRRALGGFGGNFLFGLMLLPYALILYWAEGSGLSEWLVPYTTIVNLGVLGIGALIPIYIPGLFANDGWSIVTNLWALFQQRATPKQEE